MSRLIAVLGYSDGSGAELHPVSAARLARAQAEAREDDVVLFSGWARRGLPRAEADLAARLLADKAVPQEFPEDALHIAVAAVNGIDIMLTWNFAHINNPFRKMFIRQTVENAGYRCPEICSPDELMEAQP